MLGQPASSHTVWRSRLRIMFLRSRYSSPSRARTRIHSGRRPSTCSVTPASSRRRISRTGVPSDPPARRPGGGPAPPVRRPISTNWRSTPRSSRGEERRFEAAAPAPTPFWRSFSAVSAVEESPVGASAPPPRPAPFRASVFARSAGGGRQPPPAFAPPPRRGRLFPRGPPGGAPPPPGPPPPPRRLRRGGGRGGQPPPPGGGGRGGRRRGGRPATPAASRSGSRPAGP